MGVRGVPDDDRATVDLGPRAISAPVTESLEDPFDDEPIALEPGAERTSTVHAPPPTDMVHQLPTQQLPSRAKRPSSSATPSLSRLSSTVSSPVEAMRHDEVTRTRIFLKIAIATCFAGAFVALITGGDPIAFRIICVSCGVTVVGAVWMLHLARDVATYTPRHALAPAMVIAVGSFGGVYYWGVASPVAAMLTYGIFFFSLGVNARIVTAMYVLVSILHAALGLAIMGDLIVDRGIVNMTGLRTIDQVGLLAVIEFLYFITFFTARVSQRATLESMTHLEQAAKTVAHREALLAEARAELDRALKIGGPGRFTDQVVGNFKLGVLIGRGGMGEVYEAVGVTPDRANTEAAVKLLHPGTLADPTHVARFLREAQTAAKIDCPHVVRVLEVGMTIGEIPYLAMERLRGHDLAHQLRRHRKIPLATAKQFAGEVAVGLEAARLAGIVHRDLKPHNVFHAEAAGSRTWKILDFGVSKSGGSGTLTKGHVIGTPAYMAPEQARGEDVDHRADVYSFAAILYRSVTGHPSFTGKDVPSMLYDVVYRVPTQPSILATLPADVDRVLAIGLAKEARDRFATAGELAAWFGLAITGELDPEQRRRGDEVIEKYPWGTRPGAA
ncbi:MAG: serine/threonine protein kinase [Deltaproteobacteria bacterium]|nr:serine/threonine protein kinase [Deltaproteobacteria bacterium]